MTKPLRGKINVDIKDSVPDWEPLGHGFERYYGFLAGEINQWYHELVYGNHPVEPPATPEANEAIREDILERQKALGVVPQHAKLS